MTDINRKLKRGAVTVVLMAVIALVLILILTATQSRLLLSIRRSQSVVDTLVAGYSAESEVNDIMAKLSAGYLDGADISYSVKTVDGIKLGIQGEDLGTTQVVTVTASRGFATSRVRGVRRIQNVEQVNEVEMVLMLDCTSSMNEPSGTPGKTRFDAEEDAAVNFVEKLSLLPDSGKFKLGIGIFGRSSAWLKYNGIDMVPNAGLSNVQIREAISSGISSTRNGGQCTRVLDGTSVGTAFRHAHDYLKGSKKEGVKQVEIVITDGVPNSRLLDSECTPSIACGPTSGCEPAAKDYLRCTLADRNTFVPEIGYNGVRDPEVDAYSVTIFSSPSIGVPEIFQNYGTPEGYFNATKANELTGILEKVLTKILEDRSSVTIERVIPEPL